MKRLILVSILVCSIKCFGASGGLSGSPLSGGGSGSGTSGRNIDVSAGVVNLVLQPAADGINLTNFNANNFPTTTNALWVSIGGNNANVGSYIYPLATINKACELGTTGTVIYVTPGTYYQTIPATLKLAQQIIGFGRPQIQYDAFLAHSGAVTNEACIGIVTNNNYIYGIDFFQTNLTQVPSVIIGGALYGGAPGFTNLFVDNCRFKGKNDVFYNPTTNYMQSKWVNCYFESQWDTYALSNLATNDWEFRNCEFVLLDSTIAGDFSAYKNVFGAANIYKGSNSYYNCTFKDMAVSDDTAYQTWIYPPVTTDGGFYFYNCSFKNGQQLYTSQVIANKFYYNGGLANFTYDFVPHYQATIVGSVSMFGSPMNGNYNPLTNISMLTISNAAVANQGTIQLTNAGASFPSNVYIGGNVSVAGGTGNNLGGSNFTALLVTTNFATVSNLLTIAAQPDFRQITPLFVTNASFVWATPTGFDTAGNDVNYTTITVSNNSASPIVMTGPANYNLIGTNSVNAGGVNEVRMKRTGNCISNWYSLQDR